MYRSFLFVDFGQVTATLREIENRPIRKARANLRIASFGDDAFERGFGDAFTNDPSTGVDQRGGGPDTGDAPDWLDSRHSAHNLFGELAVVGIRPQPSMRLDPGTAAERINFQPAIVGERRHSGVDEIECRLDSRI